MANISKSWELAWRPILTIVVVLALWWITGYFELVNPLFIPKLEDTFRAYVTILSSTQVYYDAFITIYRAVTGLIISFVIAVPLGLIFGRFHKLYEFFELPIDFFRSIPSSALFFLFILGFGIGNASKIAVVVYGCALIMLVGTVYGARPTREKQDRINMLVAFGANKWQLFYYVIFRDAIPHIAASVRVCVSLAFVLVIVTEMFLGASDGLGHRLYDHYLAYRVPDMYCLLIILGLIGFAANKLSFWMERQAGFWRPQTN